MAAVMEEILNNLLAYTTLGTIAAGVISGSVIEWRANRRRIPETVRPQHLTGEDDLWLAMQEELINEGRRP
jgi:hypothetical protein